MTLFKHKWIALFVFLLFLALSASATHYIRAMEQVSPNIYELIMEQTNEPQMILFSMMYILLLFSVNKKENIDLLIIGSLCSAYGYDSVCLQC